MYTDTHMHGQKNGHTNTDTNTQIDTNTHGQTDTHTHQKPGRIHRTQNILSQAIYNIVQCMTKFSRPNLLYTVNGSRGITYNL